MHVSMCTYVDVLFYVLYMFIYLHKLLYKLIFFSLIEMQSINMYTQVYMQSSTYMWACTNVGKHFIMTLK